MRMLLLPFLIVTWYLGSRNVFLLPPLLLPVARISRFTSCRILLHVVEERRVQASYNRIFQDWSTHSEFSVDVLRRSRASFAKPDKLATNQTSVFW